MTKPDLFAEHARYFEGTWEEATPVVRVRFVVLDSETTGLDPRKDRLVTIGAVAVEGGEIVLEDGFEALLKVAHNTSAVTVHGVTREQSLTGMEEPEALVRFLRYLRDGVIVGHHIGHDIEILNAGYGRHFGFHLKNHSVDTMELALHAGDGGALDGRGEIRSFSLDALFGMFGVIPHDRHTASGDAFLTAQIFLRLLRLAARCGRTTLGGIRERWTAREDQEPLLPRT